MTESGDHHTTVNSQTESNSSSFPRWKRPLGLYPAVLLWLAMGAYGMYVSFYMVGPLDTPYGALPRGWVAALVSQDLFLRLLLQLLSVFQFLTAYGMLKGSSWSFPVGLAVPLVYLGIYYSFYDTYYSVNDTYFTSLGPSIKTPMLLENLLVAATFVVVNWAYFTRPSVRGYLLRWM